MKTKPMSQQKEALSRMEGKTNFGLFMEQGTGKTWTLLADAERLYAAGKIDAIAVVAPKGVHTNWVLREIPTHMEGQIVARYWTKMGGTKGKKWMEDVFNPRSNGGINPLRVFAINIDAVNTTSGHQFLERFLRATRCYFIIDESSRIKNPTAKRSQKLVKMRDLAAYRRIATGTPITKAPTDAFMQMEFLESGLLGTTSYRAFVAEYSDLMDPDHPMMKKMIEKTPRAIHAQVVKRDSNGRPIYKNLDKLQKLLIPHTYRVLKKDCLDLPPKVFKTRYFELEPAQRKVYDHLEDESRIVLADGTISPVKRLAALMKLQQVTSGYVIVPVPGEDPIMRFVSDENPRLETFVDMVEDIDDEQSVIVWARFRPELEAIAAALKSLGKTFAEYHGGVGEADREAAVNDFQSGKVQYFVGNAQSGGIGLTLTRAEQVVYYSNSFDLEQRLQSEDRAHRIGQKKTVVYTDFAAVDTIDQSITRSLQMKQDVAAEVLGDLRRRAH